MAPASVMPAQGNELSPLLSVAGARGEGDTSHLPPPAPGWGEKMLVDVTRRGFLPRHRLTLNMHE